MLKEVDERIEKMKNIVQIFICTTHGMLSLRNKFFKIMIYECIDKAKK